MTFLKCFSFHDRCLCKMYIHFQPLVFSLLPISWEVSFFFNPHIDIYPYILFSLHCSGHWGYGDGLMMEWLPASLYYPYSTADANMQNFFFQILAWKKKTAYFKRTVLERESMFEMNAVKILLDDPSYYVNITTISYGKFSCSVKSRYSLVMSWLVFLEYL